MLVGTFVVAGFATLPILALAVGVQTGIDGHRLRHRLRRRAVAGEGDAGLDAVAEPHPRLGDADRLGAVPLVAPARAALADLGQAGHALAVLLRLPRPRRGRRSRRRWCCRCFLPDQETAGQVGAAMNHLSGQDVAIGVVILLTTPLQAIGEEYALPRLPDAGLRLALRHLGRGGRDGPDVRAGARPPELPAVLRPVRLRPDGRLPRGPRGGLEAGIALHILNNLLAFGFALPSATSRHPQRLGGSWWNLPLTVTQSGSSWCWCCSSPAGWGCATRPLHPLCEHVAHTRRREAPIPIGDGSA